MTAKFCPGSTVFREPQPTDVRCPHCGGETEIWSDEPMARCMHCGEWITQARGASCIDWCAFAKECIGSEKYARLMQNRPAN